MKPIFFCFLLGCLTPGIVFATSGRDAANTAAAATVSSTYSNLVSKAKTFLRDKENTKDPYVISLKQFAAQVEAIKKTQTTVVVAAIKQHATALVVHKNAMNYSEASTSLTPCEDQEKAIGIMEGAASKKMAEKTMYNALMKRNSDASSSNEIRVKLDAFIDNRSVSAGSILFLDSGNTMTQEQSAEANRVASIITNQVPDYKLISPEHFSTEVGEKYQSFRKMKIAKISLSQKIMTSYLARKAAVYPLGEWAGNIKDKTFDSEAIAVDGKVSADTILDLEVNSRYMDPQFEKKLHTKFEAGVLHEILAMQAVNLEFQRLELEHQEFMTALTAYRSGTLGQEINGELNNQMRNKIIQSN